MIVYSEKIVHFAKEIKRYLKQILSEEVGFKLRGDRFYTKKQDYSYPIKIVLFNNSNKLGYFDSDFYELGFHESVMYFSKKKLSNLIRHEFAHYLTFITFGDGVLPHGSEFKSICKDLNWGKEVYESTMKVEKTPMLKKSSVARKIQKLIALGSSSNTNESAQAIIKSRELLLKHNINFSTADNEQVFLKRILKQKRQNAKMEATAHILETFFVTSVYNHSKGHVYLEILGSAVNIEIAEYIADILNLEFEKLWKKSNLKGLRAKNSFFHGIAKGYCKKIENLQKEYKKESTGALIIIENKLTFAKSLVYPRLSKSKISRKNLEGASKIGEQIGKKLQFKQGLQKLLKIKLLA